MNHRLLAMSLLLLLLNGCTAMNPNQATGTALGPSLGTEDVHLMGGVMTDGIVGGAMGQNIDEQDRYYGRH